MHMVIANAARGDPYPIDVLFLYMANMGWNSAMNLPATLAHLTEKDPATGEYKIRESSTRTPTSPRRCPTPTSSCPTPPISSAGTASRCSTGRSRSPTRPPMPSASRSWRPTATCARSRSVLIDLGARLRLPGLIKEDGSPKFPGGYPDYIVNHERRPGIGPLAGHRGKNGGDFGRGEPNPRQLEQYIADGCFHVHHLPEHMRYFRHVNRDYIDWARRQGLSPHADAGDLPALQRADAEDAAGRARARRRCCRPRQHRQRIETYFDPLPFWYPPFEDAHACDRGLSAARHHAAADGDVSLLGLAERLAAPDPRRQPALHEPGARRRARHQRRRLGVDRQPHRPRQGAGEADGRRQCRHGVDLERHRQAGRRLGPRPRRAGSHARLPAQSPDRRAAAGAARRLPLSNSDPVTGQAAWYDLRVRIEKAGAA